MSIRHSLLSLLAEGDRHGYQLRQEFEARTGGTWPVNIGQVYTTLGRLCRDGLAEEVGKQDDGSVTYRITPAGKAEVDTWWSGPVARTAPDRDETSIKVALAVSSPGVDVLAVLETEREETLRALQAYTRQKTRIPDHPTGGELARLLVLDQQIFTAEAQARWLDHCEQRLAAITQGSAR
jgi:DNA-binding PadR family transcriptional regulator